MNKLVKALFVLLLTAGCSQKETNQTPLTIMTQDGPVQYTVEEANSRDQMETGLMNREQLAPNTGMIFNIDPARRIAMWMKDTKISLDMIFIDADGNIVQIFENAEPMSENKIIAEVPVRAVIEINAGDVQKNKIRTGDKVTHEYFDQSAKEIPTAETDVKTEAKTAATYKEEK